MGSPEFAIPIVNILNNEYSMVGVVTQPDKPAGRGKVLTPPPVKEFAVSNNIPIIQPVKLKDNAAFEQITDWAPDLIVVAAYGQILRQNILDLPKFGCINVHASLLPRWRGASPIQAAILTGEKKTGVTIMKMDVGMDTGGIITQESVDIELADTAGTLTGKLAILGSELLSRTLPHYFAGKCDPIPQEEAEATFCSLIKKDDAIITFHEAGIALERKVKAYNPWPLAKMTIQNLELNILKAHHVEYSGISAGETVIYQKQPAVGIMDGLFVLDMVQKPGKKPVDGRSFLNGVRDWGRII